MATQQNTGGRIYTSKPNETTYQGAARSIGFNPVQAASSEKAMRDYKAAIVADGQTMSRSWPANSRPATWPSRPSSLPTKDSLVWAGVSRRTLWRLISC